MVEKRIISLSVVFVFILSVNSQEMSQYKCAYESTIIRDTVQHESYRKDTYIVQINDSLTKGYYWRAFYVDSLKTYNKELYSEMHTAAVQKAFEYNQQGDENPFQKAYGDLLSDKASESTLYKNYKKNEIIVVDHIIMLGSFVFKDELQPQDWEIQPDTMTILGYHSQKATCHYRGRNWIAWFTNEIPISEGPWKFYGLPGLITKIADDKEHYSFVLKGFQIVEEPIETQIPKKAEKTTREKFIKARNQEYNHGYVRNAKMEEAGVNRPAPSKSEKGRVRYDYIETDYKEWTKEK